MNEKKQAPAGANPLRTIRWILWFLVAAAAVFLAVAHLRAPQNSPPPQPSAPVQAPFTLVDSSGKPWSSASLTGKAHALFFGFTRCADVCPTTLSRLVALRRSAGAEDRLNVLFITIDPEHDGPEEVGRYAKLFDTPITGLTGSADQIDFAKARYGIFAEPVAHSAMGGEMAHTSKVLLFDSDGRPAGTIDASDSNRDALAKIRAALG